MFCQTVRASRALLSCPPHASLVDMTPPRPLPSRANFIVMDTPAMTWREPPPTSFASAMASRITPVVLFIMVVLAVVLLVSRLLHVMCRLFLKSHQCSGRGRSHYAYRACASHARCQAVASGQDAEVRTKWPVGRMQRCIVCLYRTKLSACHLATTVDVPSSVGSDVEEQKPH